MAYSDKQQQREQMSALYDKGFAKAKTPDGFIFQVQKMAVLPEYSPKNQVLIIQQNPEATNLKTYDEWQECGRQVNRGAKSAAIWAAVYDPADKKQEKPTGFQIKRVFDIKQTHGDDLPYAEPATEGELLTALQEVTGLHFAPALKEQTKDIVLDTATRSIHLDTRELTDSQKLAHVLNAVGVLGASAEKTDSATNKLRADAISYVVSEHFGQDARDINIAELADWFDPTKGPARDMSPDAIRENLTVISRNAGYVIQETQLELDNMRGITHEDQARTDRAYPIDLSTPDQNRTVKNQVAAMNETLQTGIEETANNPRRFLQLMDLAADMPNYSARNLILVSQQLSQPTNVKTFDQWKELGRFVQKGEKGARILVPSVSEKDGKISFKPTSVFDISQTQGDPIEPQKPPTLTNESGELTPEGVTALNMVARGTSTRVQAESDIRRLDNACNAQLNFGPNTTAATQHETTTFAMYITAKRLDMPITDVMKQRMNLAYKHFKTQSPAERLAVLNTATKASRTIVAKVRTALEMSKAQSKDQSLQADLPTQTVPEEINQSVVDIINGSDQFLRSDTFGEFLDFHNAVTEFGHSATRNLWANEQDVQIVQTARQWEAMGRPIQPDATPYFVDRPNTIELTIEQYKEQTGTEPSPYAISPIGSTGSELNDKEPVVCTLPPHFQTISVPVYDVSQTQGPPIPNITPKPLGQQVPGFDQIVDAITKATGCQVINEVNPDKCGLTNTQDKIIYMDPSLSQADYILTLAHEATHAMMHDHAPAIPGDADRQRGEVEADATSYIVAKHIGIDALDAVTPRIAAQIPDLRDKPLNARTQFWKSIEPNVRAASRTLITSIDRSLARAVTPKAQDTKENKPAKKHAAMSR